MNRQRLSGFSLMEMMVVLLIVSIVAAASAPMVNRKMVADAVGGCKWGENGNIIFYNGNRENRAVAIGTNVAPENRPRLHIASDNTNNPHIRLTDQTTVPSTAVNLHYANGSILLTDAAPENSASSVVVGSGVTAINSAGSVVIGDEATSNCDSGTGTAAPGNTVVIGNQASATALKSVAIGNNADVHTAYSIAIGSEAKILTVPGKDGTDNIWSNLSSIAIGNSAETRGANSIAIGNFARAVGPYDDTAKEYTYDAERTIAIGNSTAIGANSIAIGGHSWSDYQKVKVMLPDETEKEMNVSGQDTTVGVMAESRGFNCTAVGYGAKAGNWVGMKNITTAATALGAGSNATGDTSIAIGAGRAETGSIAIGSGAIGKISDFGDETSGLGVAIGSGAAASGPSVSVGSGSTATGWKSVSLGSEATAVGNYSVAIGPDSSAMDNKESYGVALGYGSEAKQGGLSIGSDAIASGANAIAIGSKGKLGLNTPTVTYWQWEESHSSDDDRRTMVTKTKKVSEGDPPKAVTYTDLYNEYNWFKRYTKKWTPGTSNPIYFTSIAWSQFLIDPDTWESRKKKLKRINTAKKVTKPETNSEGADLLGGAEASGISSIAIGVGSKAAHTNSVALGTNAQTTAANQIVLGTADTTVYIPGKLIVDETCYLGRLPKENDGTTHTSVYARMWKAGEADSTTKLRRFYRTDDWNIRTYEDQGLNATDDFFKDYSSSDRRLKNVGEAFKAGLEEIKKLELFHYTYKKDESKTPHVGVMAQDLMKIFPDAVWKGEDGFYRIRMEDMFYALVNAVKELDAKIEALKNNEIAELRKRVDDLEKVNAKLAKQNEKIVEQNEKLEKRINALERKVK